MKKYKNIRNAMIYIVVLMVHSSGFVPLSSAKNIAVDGTPSTFTSSGTD